MDLIGMFSCSTYFYPGCSIWRLSGRHFFFYQKAVTWRPSIKDWTLGKAVGKMYLDSNMGPQETLFNKSFRWEASNRNFSMAGNQCKLSSRCRKLLSLCSQKMCSSVFFFFHSKYNDCRTPWTVNYIAIPKSQRLSSVLLHGEVNRWPGIYFSYSFPLCFEYSFSSRHWGASTRIFRTSWKTCCFQ